MKQYLTFLGWNIHPDASLTGPDHFHLNLTLDSCDKICKVFRQAWPHFLVTNLSRKGTGNFLPNHSLTFQVLSKFPPEDQGLLVRNVVGGFHTAATQKIWDSEAPISCPMCGMDDNRSYRCVLQTDRPDGPDWVFIPLAHSCPVGVLQRAFLDTVRVDSGLPHFDAMNKVTFYTDGGVVHPCDPDACLASWSVVSDVSDLSVSDIQVVSAHMGSSLHCPLLKVVWCGPAFGHQSAARGELLAFFHALSAAEKYDDDIDISIVTDASYVCFVDFAIRSGIPDFPNHKVRNGDIIGMIRRHSQELKCSKPKVADPSRIPRTGTIFGHFTVTLMLVLLLLLRPLSRMSRRLSLTCFRVWPVFD